MKALLKAFDERDVSTVTDLLLHHDIDPNALIPEKGVTPFHLIVGNPSETFAFKITKIFLRRGGDPNVPSTEGVTPTHVASAWDRTRILHLLLLNGGDPWIQDDDQKTAFHYAFEEKAKDAMDMLHDFQKIHWASKLEPPDFEPKFRIDLERLLLRHGEEMFAYVPEEKITKSIMTQTQDISTPVQEKINVFEKDRKEIGWVKDHFQTSGEVLVHSAPEPEEMDNEETSPQRFVTTFEIHPKAQPQIVKKPKLSVDFLAELKEEVRRRQKKQSIKNVDSVNISGVEPLRRSSVTPRQQSSITPRQQSSVKEIWINSDSKIKDGNWAGNETIDIDSSLAFTSTYLTCEDDSSCKIIENDENDKSQCGLSTRQNNLSNESFVSVAEENRITDLEEGVVLSEKKLLVNPEISFVVEEGSNENDDDACSILSTASSVPSAVSYGSDRLRNELTSLGFFPGPIVQTTKKLYLKKLWRLKKNKDRPKPLKEETKNSYSPTFEKYLKNEKFLEEIPKFVKLEEEMALSFEGDNSKKKWREGRSKTSFNYLLLDSRISSNLPKRAANLSTSDIWDCFLSSVFYVGKGKRTRPYAHLYQAVDAWRKNCSDKIDAKTQHIVDIWRDDLGVVCLHVFQNIIPVEAYTREAAMIEAIGLSNLKNLKSGEYYGVASTWAKKDKIQLGVYLLHKAMLIFLNEGERQIRPFDITS